jgi:hypothetical protein
MMFIPPFGRLELGPPTVSFDDEPKFRIRDYFNRRVDAATRMQPFFILYPPKARRLSQCLCISSLSSGVGLADCWREQMKDWYVDRFVRTGNWRVYHPNRCSMAQTLRDRGPL